MAKQNKDQSFADETQQNEKTRENVQKEAESKQKGEKHNKKQGKCKKKKHRKKQGEKQGKKSNQNVIIWLIPAVIAVLVISYALRMFFWSKEIGKSSVYLNFVADMMIDVAMLVIELLLFLSSIFLIFTRKIKGACVTVSAIMVVMLYGLLAVNIKVSASINADKENAVAASTEVWEKVLSGMQNQARYQLQQYILEEDPLMENLEQYCGIPDCVISQEERPGIMAEIILPYLKNIITDTSEKELPYNYETNVLMGNVMYNSFSNLKDESEKAENESIKNRVCGHALETLDDAINCRIEADGSLHTAENRRLIGLYNIDAGACHQGIGESNSAVVHYENAAEWAIKSIYSAASENDVNAMKDAWEVLNNAADSLGEVEGSSDGDNVQNVQNIRDAYEIVIDQWE